MPAQRRRLPIGTILFFLFATFTLLEIWLIFLMASLITWPATIAVAIVSAIVGSAMAKHEGLAVLRKAQTELAAGRFPAQSLADGVMILIGGALLITPGMITDLIGFSTLVPICRRVYARALMRWGKRAFKMRRTGMGPGGFQAHFGTRPPSSGPASRPGVFDAEPGTYGHHAPDEEEEEEAIDVEFRRTE